MFRNLRFLDGFRDALAHPKAKCGNPYEPDNKRRNAQRAEQGDNDKNDSESEHF